ncbi:biotin/lipoyl-containing protein [Romboutsia sp. 1001713B170131_170501_G6]|uniref:biotin/lipoyl-containing protein n=1 Tax=Romboutsia sp. 1001713B170131_170501_G6 TaxID=2787108 RepID=UPI001A9BD359|nr:biotin/lipoyl-containing protein [Romboutsia sp. 1001713B170131_170501_G6]
MIKKYNITVNGNTYEVEVEEVGSIASQVLKTTQSTLVAQPSPQEQNKFESPSTFSNSSGNINAPMPGTISDVKVKVGDSVKKGQVLLILEAMKMENEIMSDSDGIVTSVNVSKGESVSVGDILLTIG